MLSRLDVAFSRDQVEKVYVQHRILENAEQVWQWIQDGAYIYVCGDATRMAKDVHDALVIVAEQEGKMPRDDAEQFINDLRKAKRYQRDVLMTFSTENNKQIVLGEELGPLSDNERLKKQSNLLRGTIAEDLQDRITGGFTADNFQLIRFHGMYQQDDRDIRNERTKQKLEPLHNVMLRARMPGGIITPTQWLAIDKFATEHSLYGSIRLTTRQTFQFHGVLKPNIKLMHQTLNSIGIDSIATAGDVNRNVLCTTNPVESELHQEAYEWAKKISEHLYLKLARMLKFG